MDDAVSLKFRHHLPLLVALSGCAMLGFFSNGPYDNSSFNLFGILGGIGIAVIGIVMMKRVEETTDEEAKEDQISFLVRADQVIIDLSNIEVTETDLSMILRPIVIKEEDRKIEKPASTPLLISNIHFSYTYKGTLIRMKSEPVFKDKATVMMKCLQQKSLIMFIDPKNPDKYYIDWMFLYQ
jgi:hypothetical protein